MASKTMSEFCKTNQKCPNLDPMEAQWSFFSPRRGESFLPSLGKSTSRGSLGIQGVCQDVGMKQGDLHWDQVQNLGTIGIDEVAHKKGHKHYRALLTARQNDGTVLVLEVLANRKRRRSAIP